jgi:hypothetical protein
METRERSGATEEKDALGFLRLLTALLERRVTPRLVNIVNYDDDSNDKTEAMYVREQKKQFPALAKIYCSVLPPSLPELVRLKKCDISYVPQSATM